MALQRFDFPYHSVGTRFPNRSNKITLGGNWDYTTRPKTPPSREFTLKFGVVKFWDDAEVPTLSAREKSYCANLLEDFYAAHETHEPFIYEHPRHGDLIVKFLKPLDFRPGAAGDEGIIRDFQLVLKEVLYT